jgi:hypothetical protein
MSIPTPPPLPSQAQLDAFGKAREAEINKVYSSPPPPPPVMQFSNVIKNAKTGQPIKFKTMGGTDNTHSMKENIQRAAYQINPASRSYGAAVSAPKYTSTPVRYYTSAGSVPRRRSYKRKSTSKKRRSTKRKSKRRSTKRRSTKRKSTSKKRNSVARDFKKLCKKYNLKV